MFSEINDDRPQETHKAASSQSTGTAGASRRGGLPMRVLHGFWNAFLDGSAVYGACAHGWPVKLMD